ncbi:MAG: hypothetical protein IJJ38_08735, partial [Lachnospiraceae bacterium]|nr:hypothetical protein [Lachnospiraceae bacterium]
MKKNRKIPSLFYEKMLKIRRNTCVSALLAAAVVLVMSAGLAAPAAAPLAVYAQADGEGTAAAEAAGTAGAGEIAAGEIAAAEAAGTAGAGEIAAEEIAAEEIAAAEEDLTVEVPDGQEAAAGGESDRPERDGESADGETEAGQNPGEETDETDASRRDAFPEQTFDAGTAEMHVHVLAPAGAFPRGTSMHVADVADENSVGLIADGVDRPENVAAVKAVDIRFENAEGEEIEPLIPIRVTMTPSYPDEIPEGTGDPLVVHLLDDGSAEALSGNPAPEDPAADPGDAGAAFEADDFSVYALVYVIEYSGEDEDPSVRTAVCGDYEISVTFGSESGIPSDAELYVSEIKEGEAGYEDYVAQSAAALGEKPENLAFARPFNITLKNPQTGEEYQPNGNVTVTIELLKDDLNSYASVDVVHIPDGAGEEAQVMDSTVYGESVEFETDGFSVYVLIGSGGEIVTPQSTFT